MPAAVTGVGPVCSKKDCSCYEPQFAFRFTPLIQLILLWRNGHTYLLMERFLLTPTPFPLFIFCLPLFPMWPQFTNLVVGMSDMLLPIITNVVNSSLSLGHFPSDWKTALVDPRLKKTKQGTSLSNLRPVSNLQYLSKLVESAVYDTKCSLWYESLIRIEPFFFYESLYSYAISSVSFRFIQLKSRTLF